MRREKRGLLEKLGQFSVLVKRLFRLRHKQLHVLRVYDGIQLFRFLYWIERSVSARTRREIVTTSQNSYLTRTDKQQSQSKHEPRSLWRDV